MFRPYLPIALLLAACGTSSETTAATDSTTAGTDSTTTGTATSSGSDTGSDTGSTATPTSTGGAGEFCGGWQGSDGELALTLADKDGNLLMDGSTLPLECGGQGLFMFGLYPTFGGFTPASVNIEFSVTADVEGYNTNPDGHFYSVDPTGYYVGCEPLDGGVTGVLPVLPLDSLSDLKVLDGLPATMKVVLKAPGGDIVRDLQVKLAVVEDASWSFCGG